MEKNEREPRKVGRKNFFLASRRLVRIVLALLLLLLIIVGVVWLYSSNDDETHSDSLSVVPSIGGSSSLIHYKVSDLLSVRNVTSKIENALEREWFFEFSARDS